MIILRNDEWRPLYKECPSCLTRLLVEERDIAPLSHMGIYQDDTSTDLLELIGQPTRHGYRCPVCEEVNELPQEELPDKMRGDLLSRLDRRLK